MIKENGSYWLRSPSNITNHHISIVNVEGTVVYNSVKNTDLGVRIAFKVKISTD